MIRDLKGVLEREKAPIGIFLTLAKATSAMRKEAAAAGLYKNHLGTYPRLQLLTIKEVLEGFKPQIPLIDRSYLKKSTSRGT